jgi:tetratricopeptide (TPR) repeat protein
MPPMTLPPDTLEEQTRELLTELVMDVSILRGQGSAESYLDALVRASLFYPAFPSWPSPVDSWLAEAESLGRGSQRSDVSFLVKVRRAVIAMRRLDFDAALAELSRVADMLPLASDSHCTWYAVTRARILLRQRKFDAAREALASARALPPGDWVAGLLFVVQGELELEDDRRDAAQKTLRRASSALSPDLIEERVGVAQALGFLAIAAVDPPAALSHLNTARQMLRGAGVWHEVVQMNLAVGAFLTAAGEQEPAQALFAEALELCKAYPQPQMEVLLQLAMARSQAALGRIDEAVAAALNVAKVHARQGSVLGYTSMIVFIANLYVQAQNYTEAYRTLATGVAIAKKRSWTAVEDVLRLQINRLREEIVGPQRFDAMVQAIIESRKGSS